MLDHAVDTTKRSGANAAVVMLCIPKISNLMAVAVARLSPRVSIVVYFVSSRFNFAISCKIAPQYRTMIVASAAEEWA